MTPFKRLHGLKKFTILVSHVYTMDQSYLISYNNNKYNLTELFHNSTDCVINV